MRLTALLAALLLAACQPSPDPVATDPSTASALRIVTLAPHLAEMVFAVGAGDSLVGVSAWSDYPEAVTQIPLVGDAFAVDHEQLALLKPDLLLVWESGMPASTVQQLRERGYRVEVIRTRGLGDIESAIRQVGELAGQRSRANGLATEFREQLDALRADNLGKTRLRVFFQISQRPLYTVNQEHYLSEILDLCGGDNVFAELPELAPSVDVEAVIARRPDVLLTGGDVQSLKDWYSRPSVPAVENGQLYALPADEAGRPGPRVLVAAKAACESLDKAREASVLR